MFTPEQTLQIAKEHHLSGRIGLAEALYRQLLAQTPDDHRVLNLLGVLAAQARRFDHALALLQRAIELHGDDPGYHRNLGSVYRDLDRGDEGIACYRRAVELWPDFAEAHDLLGVALREQRRFDEAVVSHRRALDIEPNNVQYLVNLGATLGLKGEIDAADACIHRTLELQPNNIDAHYNLGVSARTRGDDAEAVARFEKCLTLDPNDMQSLTNLGNCYQDLGRYEEAALAQRRAVAVAPNNDVARINLGLILLLRGEFAEGWRAYESRHRFLRSRDFAQPLWDGSPLQGRTVLVYAEQGFGDTIHFFRYLALLKNAGATIVAEYQPELRRLLRGAVAEHSYVPPGGPAPAFDVHCPLLNLPRFFGTTLETIPVDVPYLHPDAGDVEAWRGRLAGDGLKIGLAWAGNKEHRKDRHRSIRLATLAPLGRAANVRFFSLQKGEQARQARDDNGGLNVIDLTEHLNDYADTAALIANLDLVITVDTAVAHLAGAMGKPTWTLIPFSPDWRWLLNRNDSPWYPTMRLFRQPALEEWSGPIEEMADALVEWASDPSRR